MSGFSPDWLALREPYDHAARDRGLVGKLAEWADARPQLKVADLGAGTGSTVRALAPFLQDRQSWHLVENDPVLVEAGEALLSKSAWHWRYEALDISNSLEQAIPDGVDIITCSALADLVSRRWLEALVDQVLLRGCALYLALTYDGRLRWRPGDIHDPEIRQLFHRHQQRDKGFGPALGPKAADEAATLLEPHGISLSGSTPWRLGYADKTIQEMLLEGFVHAAHEIEPSQSREVDDWRRQRQRAIDAGRSALLVGHRDLLFLPKDS